MYTLILKETSIFRKVRGFSLFLFDFVHSEINLKVISTWLSEKNDERLYFAAEIQASL